MVDYIDSINVATPTGKTHGDELDDELRGLKDKLYNTLGTLDGAVTATDDELNYVKGVTSAIQTQLTNLSNSVANLQNAPYVKTGKVTDSGTSVYGPAGWTTAKLATGHYRITHNLGLAIERYAPSGDPLTTAYTHRPAVVTAVTTNYFELKFTVNCITLADVDFVWTLGVNP